MSKLECHHLMFTRSSFNSSVEGKRLRENKSLIPDIDAEAHNLLHRNCHPVPLMGFHALRRVNKLYIPLELHLTFILYHPRRGCHTSSC